MSNLCVDFENIFSGMLIAGMDATHVNNILSGMNLSYVDPATIKKKEEELGPVLRATAKESCKQARQEEVAKSENGAVSSDSMSTTKRWLTDCLFQPNNSFWLLPNVLL